MTKALDIAGGIALGGLISFIGLATLCGYAEYSAKRDLKNHQTIRGAVVDENFNDGFLSDQYQVSIMTPKGRKILVDYRSFYSGREPSTLNTLFARGDHVELNIATNEQFDGNQKFVGVSGKLAEDKTKGEQ